MYGPYRLHPTPRTARSPLNVIETLSVDYLCIGCCSRHGCCRTFTRLFIRTSRERQQDGHSQQHGSVSQHSFSSRINRPSDSHSTAFRLNQPKADTTHRTKSCPFPNDSLLLFFDFVLQEQRIPAQSPRSRP